MDANREGGRVSDGLARILEKWEPVFRIRNVTCAALLAASLGVLAADGALAQPYPSRPIKMIVPFPPGGADVMARLTADRLSTALGQPVIVENRAGGGGGTVGTKVVAAADPDGHTLLFTSPGPLTSSAAVYKNLDYDPIKSFVPVAMIAVSPFVLVVHPAVPVRSMQEFVAYARANPGKISYASVGYGTFPHLFYELLKQRTGVELVHIPYRGSAPAITDLLAGQVQTYIDNIRNVGPFIAAGNLRALAVTSEARTPELSELPTMPESGYADFLATYWNGVLAPAGTPAAIVDKLNAVINASLNTPEMRASVTKLGMAPKTTSPRGFADRIAAEFEQWTAVAKAANIKVD
jgi:tripartite-type tricarboxylate transporter receptor subunit TctC